MWQKSLWYSYSVASSIASFNVRSFPSNVLLYMWYHHETLFPPAADCELTWLMFFQVLRSWVLLLRLIQSLNGVQEITLSLHLDLGLPLFLLPCTFPSKHSLERPMLDLLMWPKSLRVLLRILAKRGAVLVISRNVVILVLSNSLRPVINRRTWFWKTSIFDSKFLFQVTQSKP